MCRPEQLQHQRISNKIGHSKEEYERMCHAADQKNHPADEQDDRLENGKPPSPSLPFPIPLASFSPPLYSCITQVQ